MEKILNKIAKISSLASRYIGIIIIAFSCVAFFWRDGFAWMTNYTSVFLGVIMFGMGLTIKMEDFRIVFSRPKEVVIGAVAQYTIMPVVAWILCKVMNLPADLALGVILVGCCPGGTASNVITYIAGGDVALSVGMTIVSTLAAPCHTVSCICSGRSLGGSIFLGYGALCDKSDPGSGTSGNHFTESCRRTRRQSIQRDAADLSDRYRYDHRRNRGSKCRQDLKLWSSGAWSGGYP